MLLFRAMTDTAAYESALADAGFDYHVTGGAAFFGQQEVLDLINVLSVLEDPHDTLSLAATLRSPFGCVSDDGLFWLAGAGQGDLAKGVECWATIGEPHGARPRACGAFATPAGVLASRKDSVPIARLVDQVLDESGYKVALIAEFLGERRRANLRKLVRKARQFDREGGSRWPISSHACARTGVTRPARSKRPPPTSAARPFVSCRSTRPRGWSFPSSSCPI